MSNRSPKRILLTERKVRSVIREEINTRYGNNLTARQKVMLEQGILQGVKNALGGIFGVGSAGGKYIASKVGGIGANITKAVDGVKKAYATGQLGPAIKAFNQLQVDTDKAGVALVAMHIKAKQNIPAGLEKYKNDAETEAKAMPADAAPTKAPGSPGSTFSPTPATAPAPGSPGSTFSPTPATVTEESLRRKYRLGLISLNEYNMKRRR